MDSIVPTATVLYNYDTDRDAFPALVIARGGGGADEDDSTKYQAWRTPVFDSSLVVDGDVLVSLWTGTKEFDATKRGAVTVYLRDFDGSTYVTLGGSTHTDATWQDGSPSWVLEEFHISVGPRTVALGHSLELKVIVEASSDDDMWFAYDTVNYKSQVDVSN
jgi:hypothetical protein